MSKRSNKNLTKEEILLSLESFIDHYILKKEKLDGRAPNFPEEISESIVRILINEKENILCKVNEKSGDLVKIINGKRKKVEVKCFCSKGPSSFSPSSSWDELYFLDAINFKEFNFKLYRVSLCRDDDIFLNIKVNSTCSFKDQCSQGRRPRIGFYNLKPQLPDSYVDLIFDGNIKDFFNINNGINDKRKLCIDLIKKCNNEKILEEILEMLK